MHARSDHAFSLLELLVALVIVTTLAFVVLPRMLGTRDKVLDSACDDQYVKLALVLQNELDSAASDGDPHAARSALEASLDRHGEDVNPVDGQESAFVATAADDPACPEAYFPSAATKCQVVLCYDGERSVILHQFWRDGPRSVRVTVD